MLVVGMSRLDQIGRAAAVAALFVVAGCGPRLHVNRVSTSPLPAEPPAADVARVVFVRAAGVGGHAVSVWDGDDLVAFVRGGQTCVADLAPGAHRFLGVFQNADVLDAELAGGKTYYVHVRVANYYMGTSVFLDPLHPGHENWDKLDAWLTATRHVELIPEEAPIWTERHRADNARRLQRYEQRDDADKKAIAPDFGV
jgi:hypothetical protein